MYEQWHPLGVVGIISAFNFPVAVWNWNYGHCLGVWKRLHLEALEKTPLTAVACQNIWNEVTGTWIMCPKVCPIIQGDYTVGEMMTHDKRALISATGSIRMGKIVAQAVAARLGKSLLEARRKQRHHRRARRRPQNGRSRDRVWRRGNLWPALHLHPPAHHPQPL